MARDDNKVLIQVEHQIYPEWGVGNVYDVKPQTDMALVAFENVDTEKYGLGSVRRKWYPLDHLEGAEEEI
ncbi:hypothetical protein [Paenibacillus sp. IHBB 10380]|uniref:hypothetical protein n=1 Tax=Paenibacillus sp. IHBB 10380 TaxID=1566358 RepID=UPI0005CF94F1|nr:hypothetical protein [Paenibacillus sp. IHBB 10380]AJS57778.1 hypothetical protein UB51_03895 [Paenibacillus sp. IHBB 10380]